MTATASSVFTAAQFNTHVRDNLLETAVAKATGASHYFVSTGVNTLAERDLNIDEVSASETTTSTSYVDLATTGPTQAATTGGRAIVVVSALISNSTAGANAYMSWAVSGASTIAASDTWALQHRDAGTTGALQASRFYLAEGLTSGSNTFTGKYKVSSGTGTFVARQIVVMGF